MSLTSLFHEAKLQAARTGTDRPLNLSGGARLVVRVQQGVVTLTIARGKGKKVGTSELETFKRDLSIPPTAQRYPLEGQGQRIVDGEIWHYVAYRFAEQE